MPRAPSRQTNEIADARDFALSERSAPLCGLHWRRPRPTKEPTKQGVKRMRPAALRAARLGAVSALSAPTIAAEAPKYGGTLTFMIPADSLPSFDAHREQTCATIHSAAPFYSALARTNPMSPGSTTDVVCDLCTVMPRPKRSVGGNKPFTSVGCLDVSPRQTRRGRSASGQQCVRIRRSRSDLGGPQHCQPPLRGHANADGMRAGLNFISRAF